MMGVSGWVQRGVGGGGCLAVQGNKPCSLFYLSFFLFHGWHDTCSVFVRLPGAYTPSVLFPLFQLDRDKVSSVIQDAMQQPPKTAGNGTGPEIFPLPVQVPSS